jgi:hypothetical protein
VRASFESLQSASIAELEALFLETPDRELPQGAFRGLTLARLDNRGARKAIHRASQKLLFEWIPWGVRFRSERGVWFFFGERLRAGSFVARLDRSRWRDTRAYGMHYEVSRLPRLVRTRLYDEVKPLSDDLMLGIGGTNEERDDGDHFFYVLAREPK